MTAAFSSSRKSHLVDQHIGGVVVEGCGDGKGEGATERGKRLLACFGGGVLLFFAPSLVAETNKDFSRKLASGRFTPSPNWESAELGPPQCLCRANLLPRLRLRACKIFDSPVLTQRSLPVVSLPSLQPPIREVSRRKRQSQSCAVTLAIECPSGSPDRRIVVLIDYDTARLTWTS